jgi:hypothetical protein
MSERDQRGRWRRTSAILRVCAAVGASALVATPAGASGGTGISVSGSLPNGEVGARYFAMLQISGGTPPYTFTAKGTIQFIGIDVSIDGSRIEFSGTPTKAGAWWWNGVISDSAGNTSSATLKMQEMFDGIEIRTLTPHHVSTYRYGPNHCCKFDASIAPRGFESGAPYGTVFFYVDSKQEATAQLAYSPLSPGAKRVEEPTESTIAAGRHVLRVLYNPDNPVPSSITGLDGFTKNPYREESVSVPFTVVASTTRTFLSEPAAAGGKLSFPVSVSGTDGSPVDPGTVVDLYMDGPKVSSAELGAASLALTATPRPGRHTFVAKYLGNGNEEHSSSPPLTITVSARG